MEVALADICGEEMRRTGLDTNPNFKSTPSEFASLLLERGVLATGRDGRYGVGDSVDGPVARDPAL